MTRMTAKLSLAHRSSAHLLAAAHLSDEAVAAFSDGVLGEGARARAEQHLGECPECREAVHDQRRATALLRSAPLPCLPAGLADRLRNVPGTATVALRGFTVAALSPDNQPMFAAFHVRDDVPASPAVSDVSTSLVTPSPPTVAAGTAVALPDGHRRGVSAAGLGLLAATAVTVSMLATTASSAGGAVVAPPVTPSPASGPSSPAATLVRFDVARRP